jgi:hypothetical protein
MTVVGGFEYLLMLPISVAISFLFVAFAMILAKKTIKDTSLFGQNSATKIILLLVGFLGSTLISLIVYTLFANFLAINMSQVGWGYLLYPILSLIVLIVTFFGLNFLIFNSIIKQKIKTIKYVLIGTCFTLILLAIAFGLIMLLPIGLSSQTFLAVLLCCLVLLAISISTGFYLLPKEMISFLDKKIPTILSYLAGIVSVLFLLFVLISLISIPVEPPVIDPIGNAITAIKNGGAMTTQEFIMKKGEIIDSKDFMEKGIDQNSVLFALDKSLEHNSAFNIEVIDYSSVINSGVPRRLKANVTCETTGEQLTKTLNSAGVTNYTDAILSHCGKDLFSPCCLVTIRRA